MLNRKLVTIDGMSIYPEYLTAQGRQMLFEKYGDKSECIFCGCSTDDNRLYYKLSKDLKIYPEHQHNIHAPGCLMEAKADKQGFSVNPDSGEIVVQLKFKPNAFSVTGVDEEPERIGAVERVNESSASREKSYKLDLADFIRNLFIDAYNERIASDKKPLSKDYFYTSIMARLKKVRVAGMKVSLLDCKLDNCGFQFFLFPFIGFNISEPDSEGRVRYALNRFNKFDNQIYQWFMYNDTVRKCLERFQRRYGVEPDFIKDDVWCAGFRYEVKKKGYVTSYKVVGRLELFVVNQNGLFCRSLEEQSNLNLLMERYRKESGKLFLGNTDDFYDALYEGPDGTRTLVSKKIPKGLKGYNQVSDSLEKGLWGESDVSMVFHFSDR